MKIVITIEGKCASGKTVIATEVYAILINLGFSNVTFRDPDLDSQSLVQRLNDRILQMRRLLSIRDREIVIQTKQLPRVQDEKAEDSEGR